MFKLPARIISKLILIGFALTAMLLSSCSSYKLSLLNFFPSLLFNILLKK